MKKKTKKKKREKLKNKKNKKKRKNTVDYCCNPQCFVCGGTVNPPHGLVYLLMLMLINNAKPKKTKTWPPAKRTTFNAHSPTNLINNVEAEEKKGMRHRYAG